MGGLKKRAGSGAARSATRCRSDVSDWSDMSDMSDMSDVSDSSDPSDRCKVGTPSSEPFSEASLGVVPSSP
jgi:hypothetical protein